jgi:hypothetical protein
MLTLPSKPETEMKEKYPCINSSGELPRREHVVPADFHHIVQDSRWVCDVMPPSPIDEKAFASMGVQYLVGSVETQPVTFL